ncbi:L,D-transpeptidase family protein [Anaerospora sp.]|uniref:L,D-transpeptidase family protein n=1 Tax=Anaerospora sp. TaxID=1960278 RepID=UPI0028A2BE6E|nr:L,D-transpeptidase family protein [Anaerospora sp.]
MFYVRLVIIAFCVLVLSAFPGYASRNPDLLSPAVVINLPSRTLELYSGNTLVKTYPVAIGKFSTPTPQGTFFITSKEIDPAWYPPKGGKIVQSGPDNPLGYRWMEFFPLYGIHGTNAPWAIGEVVSNGCVRMQEEDVEELFEIIPCGTPVYVTYERIKVRVDEQAVSIGIYPDVYDHGGISVEEVKQKLAAHNLQGLVTDAYIKELIREEADQQVIIAQFSRLKVNDKMLAEHAIIQGDTNYIPVWAIAKIAKMNVIWNEQTGTVKAGAVEVPAEVKGNIIYVTTQNLQILFGGQVLVKADEKVIEYNIYSLMVNNKSITGEAKMTGEVLAVPVLSVIESLGYRGVWDNAGKALFIQGRQIPVIMIGNQPYLPITQIYEYLRAYVFLNQQTYTIELTYPFTPQ